MWWIIIIVVVVLLVSIIIITSAVSLHKPTVEEIGEAGEAQVREVIEDYNGEQYVFNNYMATRENKTSQIDHIVINKYGVFVIETKKLFWDNLRQSCLSKVDAGSCWWRY